MVHITMSIINVIFVILLVTYYNKKEKAYIKRIKYLINHFTEYTKTRLRNFYNIFNNLGFLINKYKPISISMYHYEHNATMKSTYIKFVFQIVVNHNENVPVFDKDTYIPVSSNIILSDLYKDNKKSITLYDKHVNMIDTQFKETRDKKILIVNFYNENKPHGFITATFNKKDTVDINSFTEDIQRLFNPLSKLIIN